MSILTLALIAIPDASACGGFFCNNVEPIKQEGEAVVFEVNPELDTTRMHVQVSYEGPPMEFAWVVPVSGVPDLFVSNDALFAQLERYTAPQFNMWWEYEGVCGYDLDASVDADGAGPPAPAVPENPSETVQVLAKERVGPYDTVVLQAEDQESLISWLQDNHYAVPNQLGGVLAPYVADGHNFVALKLANGEGTGDLVPLGLEYEGQVPAVPLNLTSVAATPDMQMVVYVLGQARAVPTNYLHVELNELAIDWFDYGSNYLEVLSQAADEAGGHAFSTEYAGPTSTFENFFWQEGIEDVDFASASGPTEFLSLITSSGLQPSTELLDFLRAHIPVPETLNENAVYNNPGSYNLDTLLPDFDAASAAADLQESILAPLQEIDAMFERTTVITRLGSTVSPAEMTVDPMFGFNEDLEATVSNLHQATLVLNCDDLGDDWNYSAMSRVLRLSDGTEVRIPSDEILTRYGLTASDYLGRMTIPAAIRIEQLGTDGQGELMYDGKAEVDAAIDRLNGESDDLEGKAACGCSSSGSSAGWLVLLAPLFFRARR